MKEEYGNCDNMYGWVIDHVFPLLDGGDGNEINLRPMHIKNNKSKGKDYPFYFSSVSSVFNKNESYKMQFEVNKSLQKKLKEIYKDA